MADKRLAGGPLGARLVKTTRRYFAAVRDGFNSGSAAKTTRWHLPRSLHDMKHFTFGPRRYAILVGGKVVGTCGLHYPQFSGLELVIAIFEKKVRGLGVGTFAVRAMCDVAFADLKIHRVELGVYPDNAAGIAAYRKCGFKREATLRRYMYHEGRWRDVLWMSLLRKEWTGSKRRVSR